MDNNVNQRFGVEEIRKIRDEDYERYTHLKMTPEEISKDISERAKEGRAIIERIRQEKAARQAV